MLNKEITTLEDIKRYNKGANINVTTDKEYILMLQRSSCASTWGAGPIENSNYYKLAELSPVYKGARIDIIICENKFIEN